jgi:hypothetical protein
MTREDAITIVEFIVNSWPGPDWEPERLNAYVNAILPLDAEATTKAVAKAVEKLKFRPSVAELREFVRMERQPSERELADYMPVEAQPKPAWVSRWERARAARDMRPFPEQLHALDKLARVDPEHYRVYAPPQHPLTDAEHWVQPSEFLDDGPTLSVGEAIVTPYE